MITITLCRKPLAEDTIVGNALQNGCGAINIDATRMPSGTEHFRHGKIRRNVAVPGDERKGASGGLYAPGVEFASRNHPGGRWPANLLLQHSDTCTQAGCDPACVIPALDKDSGERESGGHPARRAGIGYGSRGKGTQSDVRLDFGDKGGASRFFRRIFR
jgi:hypothetical protein